MRRIRTEQAVALWLALASVQLGAVLPLRVACAEDGAARAEARLHFARGVTLAKQRAYADALLEFQRAYAVAPHFSVLYNVGQAQVALGQSAAAVATLQRYLDEGGPSIEQNRRSEVESTIARERERLGEASAKSPAAVPEEPIADLVELTPKAFAVDASSPAVAPSAPSAAPVAAPASAAPPSASATLPAVRPERPHPEASRASKRRTFAYVLGGAGVALSAGAFAHYSWNRERYAEWQSRFATYQLDPTASNRQAANSLSESITRASSVTVALLVGAGLALGTGTVLFVTASGPDSEGHARRGNPFVTVKGTF